MKVTPIAQPQITPQTTTANSDARARAIAMLSGPVGATQGNQQTEAVANPNAVSVEEMSAVQASVTPQTTETIDKTTTIEDTTPKVDPETEKKFQELTRQERILRAKAQKHATDTKAKEDALNAREAALAAREKQLDPTQYIPRSRIKAETLGVLAEEGIDYNNLTEQLLSQTAKDPRVEAQINTLQQTIKSLEARLEGNEKSQTEQRTADYNNALKQIERDTTALVKADAETYEAISKTPGAIKEVVKLIERTYQKDGVLMTIDEAVQEVENYLIEEGVNQVSKIDKIKKRLAEANASTAVVKTEIKKIDAKPEQTQMKTLTNAQASTRKLSARERALLAFKNELK